MGWGRPVACLPAKSFMANATNKPDYLLLGELLRPHGVRGEMRMRILTDYPERIKDLERLYLGDATDHRHVTPYTIETTRFHKDYLLIKFEEIKDRNEAEALRGQFVMVELANAIPLEDDEFYLFELIGLSVQTDTGHRLGTIRDVMETGANDVYVVNSTQYGELLIPAHDETIVDIDIAGGWVTVKLPDGLLPS